MFVIGDRRQRRVGCSLDGTVKSKGFPSDADRVMARSLLIRSHAGKAGGVKAVSDIDD